jgi:hypothetical protein
MPDLTAIGAALASFKAAKDIAQAMIGLRDAAAFQSKMIEFQSAILDAQGAAFAANDERTALIEKVSHLETQITKFEAWETEKQRYELYDVGVGSPAYIIKDGMRGTEPPHWLCAHCYTNSKKSILQNAGRSSDPHYVMYRCPACKNSIRVHYSINPVSFAEKISQTVGAE